ncbi:type II toxin-antitoxin system VapC family toxin [Brevibacterium sp.]|uniref:type II toxin-antitoxin system VapC family toxin n=1 Tax=Brevibacterium sp. TaxID=1701 RepID=UPI0025BDD137|nr:type II toxin-antitoxin system VapC family toxin [Brevibacterium sp.]
MPSPSRSGTTSPELWISEIILDTDVVSEVLRPQPDPHVVAWLESLIGEVAVSAITVAELLAGVRRMPEGRRRAVMTSRIEAVVESYRDGRAVLSFDDRAAGCHADVLVARERTGRPISTADAQIAAICLAHDATCATHDVKGFALTGVELLNPWSGQN